MWNGPGIFSQTSEEAGMLLPGPLLGRGGSRTSSQSPARRHGESTGWMATDCWAVLLPAPKPRSPRRREEADSALTRVVSGPVETSRERTPPPLLSGCGRRILAPKSRVMLALLHAQLLSSWSLLQAGPSADNVLPKPLPWEFMAAPAQLRSASSQGQ